MENPSDLNELALVAPLMLLAVLVFGYFVDLLLGDKGLGLFGNGAFLMLGLFIGGFFMSFCQNWF